MKKQNHRASRDTTSVRDSYRRGRSKNSSDLDGGRRPELKSDEKRDEPLLFIEILQTVEHFSQQKKC